MRNFLVQYLKGDLVIWMITLLLLALSIITVYSFVPILVRMEGSSPIYYLFKHLIYVVLGFASIYFIHRLDSKYISQIAKISYYFAIALLIFTWFFGKEVNGAGRWVAIPFINITFQSSDFAKLALFLYLSKLLVKKKDDLGDWKKGILPLMIPIVVICALILKDNLSTALLVFMLSMLILFIGRVPITKLLGIALTGIILLSLVVATHLALPQFNILPRFETWKNRLANKIGTEQNAVENAQALDARMAIHKGSFLGEGIGDGKLKEYIPEAYADFYYASFVEEFGSFISVALIMIYLVLLYRIIRIGLKSDNLFETYVCLAIGLHLLAQASVNMLVCTGVAPVTGQNMPFLAMGGSALIMACVSIGIIQSFAVKQSLKTKSQETE